MEKKKDQKRMKREKKSLSPDASATSPRPHLQPSIPTSSSQHLCHAISSSSRCPAVNAQPPCFTVEPVLESAAVKTTSCPAQS
ncbi:hypothetical protein M0R45_019458 [Rubus argutus]|uniref:Uncharacterized protein n=1 Tax=Rubus argutus TaxID=59490 RepID=A0AAW1X655_RUBAR